MKNIIKIIILLKILGLNISQVSYCKNPDVEPVPKIAGVVLKPKIVSSEISQVKYEMKLEYLRPYLDDVLITEDPALQTVKSKSKIKKPYIKNGKVIIESEYFKKDGKDSLAQKFKNFFAAKKRKKPAEKDHRYVIGLEKKFRKMAGTGDTVFVAGITKENNAKYIFVDPKKPIYHPFTKEYLGTEMLVIGTGRVVKRADVSWVIIESSKKPITPGTMVMPSRSLNLSETIEAVIYNNSKKEPSYVLSIVSGLKRASASTVVIVNFGKRDGAKIGQLLQVKAADLVLNDPYKKKTQYTIAADHAKGEIMIYDIFDKLSLGLIIKSSAEISILDPVE